MTATLIDDLRKAGTLDDAARMLGEGLGLDAAAPTAVTQKALDDPAFAKMLVALRKLPEMRDQLIANVVAQSAAQKRPRTVKVVKQAAKSMLKWGMEGMKPAEPWVITRRIAACNACEHQVPAPDTMIYRGAKVAVGKDAKICDVCDCLTNTKAAISTEHCPEKSQDNPELSRWGEPWVPEKDRPKGPW